MNKFKKFVEKNKTPLLEIAGYAALEFAGILTYTMVCNHYGFKMVKPVVDAEDNWGFIGVLGKKYHVEKVAR